MQLYNMLHICKARGRLVNCVVVIVAVLYLYDLYVYAGHFMLFGCTQHWRQSSYTFHLEICSLPVYHVWSLCFVHRSTFLIHVA